MRQGLCATDQSYLKAPFKHLCTGFPLKLAVKKLACIHRLLNAQALMQVEQRTVFTQRSRSFLSRRVGRSGQRFSIRWPSLQRVMITQQSSLAVRCAPDPCLEFVLNSGLSAPTHCLCSQAVNNPNGQSQQSPPLQTWIKSAHTSKARLSGQGLGFEVQYWARHAFHPKPSSGVLPGENTCRILETQVRLPVYGRKKKISKQ